MPGQETDQDNSDKIKDGQHNGDATPSCSVLSDRVARLKVSDGKRKMAQNKQAESMKKRRADATFVELGAAVTLTVDPRDQAGHTSRGMVGIVVRKSDNGLNSVILATMSGILSSNKKPIYYGAENYKVHKHPVLTEKLKAIQSSVRREGELYLFENLPHVSMAKAHMTKYGNHDSDGTGRGRCKCKGGRCTKRCGCRQKKIPCSSTCGCSGTGCGNNYDDDKKE
jgi:hypothetical protein